MTDGIIAKEPRAIDGILSGRDICQQLLYLARPITLRYPFSALSLIIAEMISNTMIEFFAFDNDLK